MRGPLTDDELKTIALKIKTPDNLKDIIMYDADTLAIVYGSKSRWPEAFVCLHDAIDYINEARLALSEMEANYAYYLKMENQKAEATFTKIFTSRFYADDVCLRLYSAAEHLANFLKVFYNIPQSDIDQHGKASTTSLAIKIGKYFISTQPDHPVTCHLSALVDDAEWKFVTNYRNQWVHDQRPLLKNYGIQFKRRNRWKNSSKGAAVLTLALGDQPELDIETLMVFAHKAYTAFTTATSAVFDIAIKEIECTPQYVSKGNWKTS